MTPTYILQYEERIRREQLGLPPEEPCGISVAMPIGIKGTSVLDTLRGKKKNKWRNIKKGKL